MNEDQGLKTIHMSIGNMHCERCVNTVQTAIESIEGVDSADVTAGGAEVRFLPQLVTQTYIEGVIDEAGYPVQKSVPKKGFFGRFLERMIESNEKNFGNERLDCCKLSSNPPRESKSTNL